jgi:hypothetical protein
MVHTLRLLKHSTKKRTQRMAFEKMPEEGINLYKLLKD